MKRALYWCHRMSNPGFHSTWTAIQFIVLLSVCRRLTGTLACIRQFSEAGLREWIPFVIFRARSRERSQLPFPGLFLSRRCFTLCIIMEIETRIAKHYKCHYRCVCKDYRGKVMKGGKGDVFASFRGWPEDRECVERLNVSFGNL